MSKRNLPILLYTSSHSNRKSPVPNSMKAHQTGCVSHANLCKLKPTYANLSKDNPISKLMQRQAKHFHAQLTTHSFSIQTQDNPISMQRQPSPCIDKHSPCKLTAHSFSIQTRGTLIFHNKDLSCMLLNSNKAHGTFTLQLLFSYKDKTISMQNQVHAKT